jgi:hypothetical protein
MVELSMMGCTMKKQIENHMFSFLLISFMLLIILLFSGLSSAQSILSVESSQPTLEAGEEATISIHLDPDASVKSFEFGISFNQSLLEVSDEAIGDFFDGFTIFSSTGSVDNTNGLITGVYALIMGDGDVSSEGVLYSFNVTALETIGDKTASVQVFDMGITNDTRYLPLTTQNLSVTVNTSYHGPYIRSPDPVDGSTGVSKSISELEIYLFHTDGLDFNYSITTSPNIGSTSGSATEDGVVSLALSNVNYETTYTWTVMVEDNSTSYSSTFTFTTEDAPEDTDNDNGGSSGGGGGGFLPPLPPAEPEEEAINHPPETPLPPQGFAYVEPGIQQTYQASSYDVDDDLIRFQIEWSSGVYSEWSEFVHSNESVSFPFVFASGTEYTLRVRCQDESGLNSSWSEPYDVFVSALNETEEDDDTEEQEIVAEVNNETGETQFTFDGLDNVSEGSHVVWDFGDGNVIEGVSPQHMYSKPGTYTVTVTITDEDGQVSMKTYTVTVPEPQDEVDTSMVESTVEENGEGGFPWIFVLVGILGSIAGVFVALRYFIEFE